MRIIGLLVLIIMAQSCGNTNSFGISRVIDGNSVHLSNGIIVTLIDVAKNESNVKILERYATGSILLYDRNSEQINEFSTDKISATIYNSDGDCINDLLSRVNQISKTEAPVTEQNEPIKTRTVVSMELENGVYIIPAEINEEPMYFIFDTGASLISISSNEADNLYNQGKLDKSDIIGKGQFTDANGDISDGTIINLKRVKIGDRILKDVQACVTQNQNAPLLLGQSALMKFGKISIDYEKGEIAFE